MDSLSSVFYFAVLQQQQPSMGWKAASVVHTMKKASKKLIAKGAARQQRKMLQQLAAELRDEATDVDERRPSTRQSVDVLPVDEAAASQACRHDILKHLHSSQPPQGVTKNTYEMLAHLFLMKSLILPHFICSVIGCNHGELGLYTVVQKNRTTVTFSNYFNKILGNINNFWYSESTKYLQCSGM